MKKLFVTVLFTTLGAFAFSQDIALDSTQIHYLKGKHPRAACYDSTDGQLKWLYVQRRNVLLQSAKGVDTFLIIKHSTGAAPFFKEYYTARKGKTIIDVQSHDMSTWYMYRHNTRRCTCDVKPTITD